MKPPSVCKSRAFAAVTSKGAIVSSFGVGGRLPDADSDSFIIPRVYTLLYTVIPESHTLN